MWYKVRTFATFLDRGDQMQSKRKISVFLPADLFERFNAYCADQGFKKSPLIARLIREHMEHGHSNALSRRDEEAVHATRKR
jgi:metal-responsive CopG/Arc/MetJ family transcriptional regulator